MHRASLARPELYLLGQEHWLEQIAHRVGHAHDVAPDGERVAPHRLPDHTEGGERGPRVRGLLRSTGKKRPGAPERTLEHCHACLLRQRLIVRLHAGRAQESPDRTFVDTAVLPDVERREMEPEGLRLGEQASHPTVSGRLLEAGVPERRLDRPEILQEASKAVPGRLGTAPVSEQRLDAPDHVRDQESVGLVPIPARHPDRKTILRSMTSERCCEWRSHGRTPVRDAQLAAEHAELRPMPV